MAEYDVAIVGAGPAGSATALRLARAGVEVLLLERSRFDEPRVGESLAPDVNPLLRDLGVELAEAQPSYGVRSLWGGEASSSTMTSPYGTGWYVDRADFDRRLAFAAADAGVHLRTSTTCLDVEPGASWTLRLSDGAIATARTLIDATGRAARIGRRLGAERLAFDRLVAITAFVPPPAPSAPSPASSGLRTLPERGGFGLVETVPDGWCYSAPAGAGRLVVMLLTDADLGRDRGLTDPERWFAALGRETTARLGVGAPSDLRVVSAVSQRLRRRPSRGLQANAQPARPPAAPWLAVGDAALATDPITGTGVVRALRSARAAADALLSGQNPTPDGSIRHDGAPYDPTPYDPTPYDPFPYEAALDQECTAYLRRRRDYYAAETRWPEAPFWARRRRTLTPS